MFKKFKSVAILSLLIMMFSVVQTAFAELHTKHTVENGASQTNNSDARAFARTLWNFTAVSFFLTTGGIMLPMISAADTAENDGDIFDEAERMEKLRRLIIIKNIN